MILTDYFAEIQFYQQFGVIFTEIKLLCFDKEYAKTVTFDELGYPSIEILNYIMFKFIIRKPMEFNKQILTQVAYDVGAVTLVYVRDTFDSELGQIDEIIGAHDIIDFNLYRA